MKGRNMTVVVDNLEREGFVMRFPDPGDRRCIHVRLIQKGRNYFELIFIKHASYITQLASVLDETEQQELSTLLKKTGLALQER